MARYQDPSAGLLAQGQQAGFYSPFGSPQMQFAQRQGALRNASNQIHAGSTLSSLFGLDPYQQRFQMLQNQRSAGQGISNYLNNAQMQQQQGTQDWFRNLYGQSMDFERQRRLQEANRPGIGAQLGGLFGGALGSFLPGIGGLFHQGGQQQYPNYSGMQNGQGGYWSPGGYRQ